MSNNRKNSSSFELFTFDNDIRTGSSKNKSLKRHIYEGVSATSSETPIKKQKKKATKLQHPTTPQVSEEQDNSPELSRKVSFSEFDDYKLTIEEDRSPRRLDWVYIEEQVEPSAEYLELMKRNWDLAKNMKRQRLKTNIKEKQT